MIRNIIKTAVKDLLSQRILAVLAGVTFLIAIAFIIYIIATVHPSEVPLVTHYTAFGPAHIYRDQWYYLLITLIAFALIVAIAHVALTVKAYQTKGRHMALFVAWMGIGILIFAWVIAASIINVWSPV